MIAKTNPLNEMHINMHHIENLRPEFTLVLKKTTWIACLPAGSSQLARLGDQLAPQWNQLGQARKPIKITLNWPRLIEKSMHVATFLQNYIT